MSLSWENSHYSEIRKDSAYRSRIRPAPARACCRHACVSSPSAARRRLSR